MSFNKMFESSWEAKFPGDPLPPNLSFLDDDSVNMTSLGSALDSAERMIKKLERELSKQRFIRDHVIERMNSSLAVRMPVSEGSLSRNGEVGEERKKDRESIKTSLAPRTSYGQPVRAHGSAFSSVFAKLGLGKTNRQAIDPEDEERVHSLEEHGSRSSKKATPVSRFYQQQKSNMYRASSEPSLLDPDLKYKPLPAVPGPPSKYPPGFKPVFTSDRQDKFYCSSSVEGHLGSREHAVKSISTSFSSPLRKSTGSDLIDGPGGNQRLVTNFLHPQATYLETDLDDPLPAASGFTPPQLPPPPVNRLSKQEVLREGVHVRRPRENIYEEPIEFRREAVVAESEQRNKDGDENDEDEDDAGASSDEEPIYFNLLLLRQQTLNRANELYTSANELAAANVGEAAQKWRRKAAIHQYEFVQPVTTVASSGNSTGINSDFLL